MSINPGFCDNEACMCEDLTGYSLMRLKNKFVGDEQDAFYCSNCYPIYENKQEDDIKFFLTDCNSRPQDVLKHEYINNYNINYNTNNTNINYNTSNITNNYIQQAPIVETPKREPTLSQISKEIKDLQQRLKEAEEIEKAQEDKREASIRLRDEAEEARLKKKQDKIKLEEAENKKNNEKLRLKREEEQKRIEEVYGTEILEPELIELVGDNKIRSCMCIKCEVIKAFPYEFLNSKGKLCASGNVCAECMRHRTEITKNCMDKGMVLCECGLEFYNPNRDDRNRQLHERLLCHKTRMMKKSKKVDLDVISRKKLELLVKENLNENGTAKIPNYTRISKPDLIKELKKIENLKIPENFI